MNSFALWLVVSGFVNTAQSVTPYQAPAIQRVGAYATVQACADAGNNLKDGLTKQGIAAAVVCIPTAKDHPGN